MNSKFNIKLLLIFFLFINHSFADEKIKRVDKVSKNLRCLICQGQSVYDSQSEFALSIRDLIIKKIDEGQTDEEIYDYGPPSTRARCWFVDSYPLLGLTYHNGTSSDGSWMARQFPFR